MSKRNEPAAVGSITVTGHGEIHAPPDVAWIHLGVTTQGKSARAAASANAERMTAVIERMKQLGIAEKRLQTDGLSILPVIQQAEGSNQGQTIGYSAENRLVVRAPIDRAGELFDAGLAAGANQSSQMLFGLQDEVPLRDRALELAVQSARHEAKIVASATGARLGEPRSIEITGNGIPAIQRQMTVSRPASTPVLPSSLTLSAQVTIVFESVSE